ncbi:MAG: hypothetical protein WDN23_13250 [Edaphobacter sp.]
MMKLKAVLGIPVVAVLMAGATSLRAAQLSTNTRTAIPHNVQQLLVMDYRAIQNSTVATNLRERVMPPELKTFDEALRKSGLNDNHDVDQLAFVLFRPKDSEDCLESVGIAEGQFAVQEILADFRKQKLKSTSIRTNRVYPLAKTGMVVCFADPSTMIFGDADAVQQALDARDGITSSLLANAPILSAMQSVDSKPLWSVLDPKGTQTMMRQMLGGAASVTDSETVRKRLGASWYAMEFQHGVKFDLTIDTGDNFAAATLASLLSTAVALRKATGSDAEKQALAATSVHADTGNLTIAFAATDEAFLSLLQSPLFQGMLS